MKRTYFLPFIAFIILPGLTTAQEISFSPIGDNSDAPVYKNNSLITELNTEGADAYPYISPDGLTLYFTRGTTISESNLYVAKRATTNDMFAGAELVSSNIPNGAMSCWLTNDQKEIYYIKGHDLYHAARTSPASEFGTGERVMLDGVQEFISGPSLSPSGNELYLYNHSKSSKKLLRFTRTSAASFELAGEVVFPPGYMANPGQLSKDGLKLYITLGEEESERLYILSRKTLEEQFSNAVMVDGVNGSNPVDQPSVSADGGVLVFVNSTGAWNDNDLGITNSDAQRSAMLAKKYGAALDVYPNPFVSTATMAFTLDKSDNVKISIYSLTGYEIGTLSNGYMNEGEHRFSLDRSGLKPGTYIARLTAGDITRTQRVVITD